MRFIVFIVTFVFALVPLVAQAQDTTHLKTLLTGNDNKGWEAVGRLNIAGSAFCTGALIAPDLVLTAAHCLYDQRTGRQFAAQEIEFLAGWRNGSANAYANVGRAIAHPNFEYQGHDRVVRVAYDVALLQLDRPIRKSTIHAFETDVRPRKGDAVGVVSYARERADSPSLQEVCYVLARRSGTLVLSCEVDFGSSGAPVFSFDDDGTARIVSIVSAKADINGHNVALGTSLEEPLADLMALMAEPVPLATQTPQVRVMSTNNGVLKSGAKFVRP